MKKIFRLETLLIVLALITLVLPSFGESDDLTSKLDMEAVLVPGLYTTDQTSSAISGGNYKAHMFGIYVSAGSYTSSLGIEFNLKHCATSGGDYTAVESTDMVGVTPSASGTIYTVDEDITTAAFQEFLYVGRMPYLKLTMDMIGDHSSATPTVAIVDVKGRKIISQ